MPSCCAGVRIRERPLGRVPAYISYAGRASDMSVTELLGIEDDEGLRELVESRWEGWLEVMPALAVVPEPRYLLEWRVTASPEDANAALVSLSLIHS